MVATETANGAGIEELRKSIWGQVLQPAGDKSCNEGLTWSPPLRPDTTPGLIVKARGTMDVQKAVNYATAHGMDIVVRGGGHTVNHIGYAPGALVLDLSLMAGVSVDPVARTATAGGGCLLGDICREAAAHGLGAPLGRAPIVGLGLVLNGGIDFATKVLGPSSDYIIGATLVKADEEVVVVDEKSDPELLWALRGAGSTMGVVTSVTLRLLDLSDAVAGIMVWPDDPQHTKWRAIVKWAQSEGRAEPGYNCTLFRSATPDGGGMIMAMMVHIGNKSRDERLAFVEPLRQLQPINDTFGKMSYLDTQFCLMPKFQTLPPNMYQHVSNGQLSIDQFTDEFIDLHARVAMDELPIKELPYCSCAIEMWGGAMSKASGPVPFVREGSEVGWLLQLGWTDPNQNEVAKSFAQKVKTALGQYGETDLYVNVSTDAENNAEALLAARVGGAGNLARLRAVKARVDPGNVFKAHAFVGLLPA